MPQRRAAGVGGQDEYSAGDSRWRCRSGRWRRADWPRPAARPDAARPVSTAGSPANPAAIADSRARSSSRGRLARKSAGQHRQQVPQLGHLLDRAAAAWRRPARAAIPARPHRARWHSPWRVGTRRIFTMLELMSISSRVASICICADAILNRRDHHIGGQAWYRSRSSGSELPVPAPPRLHGAAVQAEHVGHVGNADLRREEIVEKGVRIERGRDLPRLPLAGGRKVGRRRSG